MGPSFPGPFGKDQGWIFRPTRQQGAQVLLSVLFIFGYPAATLVPTSGVVGGPIIERAWILCGWNRRRLTRANYYRRPWTLTEYLCVLKKFHHDSRWRTSSLRIADSWRKWAISLLLSTRCILHWNRLKLDRVAFSKWPKIHVQFKQKFYIFDCSFQHTR